MGEIGRDRREFLYEMQQWEILLITRGYFRRYHPSWEQARLIAHQVHYCMGLPKGQIAKTPTEFIPFPWEKEEDNMPKITDEEVAELQAEMAAINAANKASKPTP